MWMRIVALWVSGLLASAIVGSFVGAFMNSNGGYAFTDLASKNLGAIAGALVFTCARLWLTGKSKS
jgi:hypothetical protein